jgi:hypothetical protein
MMAESTYYLEHLPASLLHYFLLSEYHGIFHLNGHHKYSLGADIIQGKLVAKRLSISAFFFSDTTHDIS